MAAGPASRPSIQAFARPLALAVGVGFVTGLVIGGIGTRIAMLVLRLTSPDMRGVATDDGFIIGRVSGDSFFLLLLGAAAGVIGGVVYLLIRAWLPPARRTLITSIAAGLIAGSVIVHPDGVDFKSLEPRWLAIAMFVAIPAGYGAVLSLIYERFIDRDVGAVSLVMLIPLLGLLVMGPAGLIVGAVGIAVWFVTPWFDVRQVWTSKVGTLVGRVALLAATLLAAVTLSRDVAQIL